MKYTPLLLLSCMLWPTAIGSTYSFINDTPYTGEFGSKATGYDTIPLYSKFESNKIGTYLTVKLKKNDGSTVATFAPNGERIILSAIGNNKTKIKVDSHDFSNYWKKHGKYIEAAPKDGTVRQPTP